jgi:hypothetical protein
MIAYPDVHILLTALGKTVSSETGLSFFILVLSPYFESDTLLRFLRIRKNANI